MKEHDYDKALRIAEMIQHAITDITEAVTQNVDEDNEHSKLAVYSALCTVTSYFDFKLRDSGHTDSEIQITKNAAEKYVLSLISEELGAIPIKKGDA